MNMAVLYRFVVVCILAALPVPLAAQSPPNVAASTSPKRGDIVRLSQGTPLMFEGKSCRAATTAEEFVVLDKRSTILFLSIIFNQKEVAANTAVVQRVVDVDASGKAERISRLAETSQFAAALALVDSLPQESHQLGALRSAIEKVRQAAANKAAALVRKAAAPAEAARIRKNASVIPISTDRITGRDVNAGRRETERTRANRVVEDAAQHLGSAEEQFRNALTSLSEGIETLYPSQSQGRMAKADIGKNYTEKQLQIAAEFMREDPPGIASGTEGGTPSFEDTMAFINGRISPLSLWYGSKSGKLNTTRYTSSTTWIRFNPADMAADVKLLTTTFGRYTAHKVLLRPATGKPKAKEIHRSPKPWDAELSEVEFYAADAVEQQKLAKAFAHLLQMLGAKSDPF